MIAAGLLKPKLSMIRSRFMHSMITRQLVDAYAKAICIGAHEPTALLTDFYGTEYFLRKHKVTRIAIPFTVRERGNQTARRHGIERLLLELDVSSRL
jgi:hypothetical protein